MAIKKAKVTIKDSGLMIWEFANGNQVEVESTEFNGAIQQHAMLHGLKQKLSDTYAGCKTASEAQKALEGALNALKQGSWNAGRSSTGGIWIEALARASGESVEACIEAWSDMTEEKQKALKADARIKLAKAEIEAERASANIDEDAPALI